MLSNQEKLDEMYELMQNNNEILRSLIRRERISNFFRILYWLFIIGAGLGVFYYFKPIYDNFILNINDIQASLSKVQQVTSGHTLPDISNVKNIIESVRGIIKN